MKNTVFEIKSGIENDAEYFIEYCEEFYHNQIEALAKKIALIDGRCIVMISGPSSSGKTTSSNLLLNKLEQMGETAYIVSLDDFYLNPENQPVLPDGTRDTESVRSLDIAEIQKCFKELMENGKSELPLFDFKNKRRSEKKNNIILPNRAALIVEGLHGLNPLITEHLENNNIIKVYISLNEPILDDNGEVYLSSRQMRLARRIIRDMKYRGTSPYRTLEMWTNVVKEEEKTLFKYKPLADMRIITLHPYEICLYKPYLSKILSELSEEIPNYETFRDLAHKAQIFNTLDENLVPDDSLIKEFI